MNAPIPSDDATAPADVSNEDLDRSLVSGVAWTAVVKWSTQLLGWASTVIVARLLSPGDYGLLGMATVYLGLVGLLSEFGLGTSIVVLRELSHDEVAQLNSIAVGLGLACFAVSCAAAAPLGEFFGSPELPAVIVAMGSTFVITSFRVVPHALLQKALRFKLLAWFEATQAVVLAGSMVVFALLGFRYWTLVIGSVLSSAVATALPLIWRPHAFARPKFGPIRRALTVSYHIIVARLTWYVQTNADFLLIGRVLGPASLGAYSFALAIATVPVEKVTSMIGRVTPAIFSAAQRDRAAMRRYLVNLTAGISMITFPAALGMALVADDFVRVVLGTRWTDAIMPLRLLAVYATLRTVSPLLGHVLNVTGGTAFAMRIGLVSAVVLPMGFYVGSRWGLAGVAAAWLVLDPLLVAPVYRRVFRTVGLRATGYFGALWPALNGCLVMVGTVLVVEKSILVDSPAALRLALLVTTGAAAYVTTIWAFHRDRIRMFADFIRRQRGAAATVAAQPVAVT